MGVATHRDCPRSSDNDASNSMCVRHCPRPDRRPRNPQPSHLLLHGCYCTDCRAFAHFLGKAPDVLDEQGGTEIVQVAQPRLRFIQGEDYLSAVRLSDKGMIRWYASCCGTPIGNTLANPKVSFIGLIHTCLDRARMNQDFGTSVAVVNTDTALGSPKPRQRGLPGVVARLLCVNGQLN